VIYSFSKKKFYKY